MRPNPFMATLTVLIIQVLIFKMRGEVKEV
jgi:hypothetical protein